MEEIFMQYSFLGFSVTKMMELNLDMKDVAILRYFVDFKDTGRMHFEIIEGKKYYWVNYRTMEEEMPYLGLGKKAIMTRMLRLRDLCILVHYTKKEGGTFSFFALGSKYIELVNKNTNKDENKLDKGKNDLPRIKEKIIENTMEEKQDTILAKEDKTKNEEVVLRGMKLSFTKKISTIMSKDMAEVINSEIFYINNCDHYTHKDIKPSLAEYENIISNFLSTVNKSQSQS
jgi:hypothetical protein